MRRLDDGLRDGLDLDRLDGFLGVWRRTPLAALADAAAPVAACGFVLAATTGVGLLATKATEYVGNPFIYIKFPAIAVGLLNAVAVRLRTESGCRQT